MTAPMMPYSQGIPVLPTMGSEAAMLGQAVQNLIAPNFQFQEQLKAALATHPEIITQLTNIEANSPGTLRQLLGPGKQTDALTNALQQPSGQASDAEMKWKSDALKAKTQFMDHLAKNNPELFSEYVKRGVFADITGEKATEAAHNEADTGRVGATTQAIQQETKIKEAELAQSRLTLEAISNGEQWAKKYPDMGSITKAWDSGTLEPAAIAAISADPNKKAIIASLLERDKAKWEAAMRAADRSVAWAKLAKEDEGLKKVAMQQARATQAEEVPIFNQILNRRSKGKKMTDDELAIAVGQLNAIEKKAQSFTDPFNINIANTTYELVDVPKKFLGISFGNKKALVVKSDGQIDPNLSDPVAVEIEKDKAKGQDTVKKIMTGSSTSSSTSTKVGGTGNPQADEAFKALINSVKPQAADNATKR